MRVQPGAASGQQAGTIEALRAQLAAVQASIKDATARREAIMARIDAAGGPGERVFIRNSELRPIDGELARLGSQEGRMQADLRMLEAKAAHPMPDPVTPRPAQPVTIQPTPTPSVPPTSSTTLPPDAGFDASSMLAGGAIAVLVLVPVFMLIVWRVGRRAALKAWRAEMREDGARLAKVEDAVNSVVLEVERVSESQRFLANTLVGNAAHEHVKEKVSTRT